MGPDSIHAVLRGLQPYDWGWRFDELPSARFIGMPVGLRIDTQPIPTGRPSPPLDSTEIGLASTILGGLASVSSEA